jgi:hypothetical protein
MAQGHGSIHSQNVEERKEAPDLTETSGEGYTLVHDISPAWVHLNMELDH